MKLRSILSTALVLGLTAVLAVGACADSVSYNTSTPIALSRTDWANSLLFQKFDPALGTLTQVDLSITGYIETTLTITNNAASPSSGNAKTHVELTVVDPLALLSVMPDIYSPKFDYSLNPGEQVVSGLLTKSASDSGSWTAAAILAEFTGSGDISMDASTFTESVLANTGGNTAASQETFASATGTVTYYYNPIVPEPTSIVVLGTMLFGAFVARRRKA